jgi:type III pantothenate kinase
VAGGKVAALASLPPDEPAAWERQLGEWQLPPPTRWALASVQPRSLDGLLAWIRGRGDTARVIGRAGELPLRVEVPEPDKVGIDRLLAAVGANARRAFLSHPVPQAAVVVGVGTAITVDLLDPAGAFVGGAILPGPRMMAQALHEHTALLPLIETIPTRPTAPANATYPAIELGIHWAMVGGINGLICELSARFNQSPDATEVYLTGGGASLVLYRLIGTIRQCPELILEGIAHTAESSS